LKMMMPCPTSHVLLKSDQQSAWGGLPPRDSIELTVCWDLGIDSGSPH